MLTGDELKKLALSMMPIFPDDIQKLFEAQESNKHPSMPTGRSESIAPELGSERTHISPTQFVVPQLPSA
eukprot:2973082-Karenia_brevis.AAC.1